MPSMVEKPSLEEHLEQRGYLTVHQLEKYLKEYHPRRAVSGPTLRRYLEKGYLTFTEVGGQRRVDKEAIKLYIANGTGGEQSPSSPPDGDALDDEPPNITVEPM